MENLCISERYNLIEECNIIHKWKIEKFIAFIRLYSYIESYKNFKSYFSNQNDINSGLRRDWYLNLNFNYINSENKEWITISLNHDSSQTTAVQCSLFILDNRNEKQFIQKFSKVFYRSEIWSIPKFLEINELLINNEKFLPNDDLTVGIELTEFFETTVEIEVPKKTPRHQLNTDLKDVFESKAGSDVVLLVGDKKILAHKLILTIRSPVFAAMFSHQLKENKENEITIPDLDPEVCEKMLEYIYTENVTGLDEIVEFLYEEADKYQLPALKELCEESFCRRVEIENAIKYLVLLDRHHADEKFFDYVLKFIALNSKIIVTTADYKQLEKINPGLLLTITTMICKIK
ncbi:speckle-type POZ protein B-like [Cotesia typhae]|uniref:speckle-type POZ protein B-like n=1 Tax=Cotesia typhae TaxID=2053667 RepID=UPI003D695DF4